MDQHQRALLVACPVCPAGVQERCYSRPAARQPWYLRSRQRTKRPHKERVELARNKFDGKGVDRSETT